MNIQKDFAAAVGRLPGHLRALVSEARSVRDTRGCWSLRDLDGNDLTPEPPAIKSAAPVSDNRPVTSGSFLRVCAEIGELFGRVERRLDALEADGTKADTTRALPTGYMTKDMRPRARWNGVAWAEVSE